MSRSQYVRRPVFFTSFAPLRCKWPSLGCTFGDDGFQRNIPGLRFNACNLLAGVGEADQSRTIPGPMPAEIVQGAVIEAAAHAETVAIGIEAHQRHHEQIQIPGKPEPPA